MNATAARAVVLAGGDSTRMGSPKALLHVDGVPAVLRVAGAHRAVGVEPLVVLGHDAGRVAGPLQDQAVPFVINERHAEGMFSSVQCGARELPAETRAFFVHPVDCVLVRSETIALLARSAAAGREVVYPEFEGRRGHPPLLPTTLCEAILAGAPAGGLRELLAGAGRSGHDVPVDDPHVLEDMDDAVALAQLREEALRERLPGPQECRALLARHGTPAPVVAHAEAVAAVAGRLGGALRAAGVCLDLRLLETAALLHDLVRGAAGHAAAAASALDADGYPRVAAVVRLHMDLPAGASAEPGEAEILYLADKLTVGAEVVSLERKQERAEELFAGDAAALPAARRRMDDARAVARRIEELTGRPLTAVAAGSPDGSGCEP